jgi:hypothetical protein
MKGFEQLWTSVAKTRDGEPVSPELKLLLRRVYEGVLTSPVSLPALKHNLMELLRYLSEEGRTNANCWAADLFFGSDDDLWERDWSEQNLPEDFHDLLTMMGEALHDAVTSPAIAGNFRCLPEQLLERVKRLEVSVPIRAGEKGTL